MAVQCRHIEVPVNKKNPEDRVKRRLYSLYKEQVDKIEQMARARSISQSHYLRELIDVAYASYLLAQPVAGRNTSP